MIIEKVKDYNNRQILENGFCGYKNQSIKELKQESKERGIL